MSTNRKPKEVLCFTPITPALLPRSRTGPTKMETISDVAGKRSSSLENAGSTVQDNGFLFSTIQSCLEEWNTSRVIIY